MSGVIHIDLDSDDDEETSDASIHEIDSSDAESSAPPPMFQIDSRAEKASRDDSGAASGACRSSRDNPAAGAPESHTEELETETFLMPNPPPYSKAAFDQMLEWSPPPHGIAARGKPETEAFDQLFRWNPPPDSPGIRLQYSDLMESQGPEESSETLPRDTTATEPNFSYPGITFDRPNRRYVVHYREFHRKISRYFPVKSLGEEKAFRKAVECCKKEKETAYLRRRNVRQNARQNEE